MAFDPVAFLDAAAVMVADLPGMQEVHKGIPDGFEKQVVALLAMADMPFGDKTTGLFQFNSNLIIEFGCRVDGNQEDAQGIVLGLARDLMRAWKVDRALGGAVQSSQLDFTLAATPTYQIALGEEFHVYPVRFIGTQYEMY